ncbi:BAR-domain-containing protein [Agrocybe pediades]|nr:BAR-domain-containing protein [Agrocybe pediades]
MASRQLGRLRQWAGEVISSKEKTVVSEEFKELESDIELRKEGIRRLILASETYHHALTKKKEYDGHDEVEDLLPVDILGVVMIQHGEQFGDDSFFGRALIKMGRAHCKVATLQEAYALTFKDTFLMSLERFKNEIKEYESLKKKLETRRLDDQVATNKFEKLQHSKKEKDRREAEDDMDRARQRYEETAEDIRAHMHAIQENEHNQLRELSQLLDIETNFVQSYLDVLRDVKAEWPERSTSKLGSHSSLSSRSSAKYKDRSDSTASSDDNATPGRHSRSGSTTSKPPSRPTSRLSRKRTNSSAAKEEKAKDGEKSRRLSVAGWASSAVDSVTGSSKSKKSKDKESFATLGGEADDEDDASTPRRKSTDTIPGVAPGAPGSLKKSNSFRGLSRGLSKRKSKENVPTTVTPPGPPKILKPLSLHEKKIVRALYDFSGSSDELNFKAGDDIVVVQEVLDDWWMGELPDGRKGLFPASYTEVVGSKPALPQRPSKNSTPNATPTPSYLQPKTFTTNKAEDDDAASSDHDHYLTSDADDEQILRAVPMAANKSPLFYGGFDDSASFTESMTDDQEHEGGPKNSTVTKTNRHVFGSEDESDDNNWLSPVQVKQQQHAPTTTTGNFNFLAPPGQPKRTVLTRSSASAPGKGEAAHSPLIDRANSDSLVNPSNSLTSGISGFFSTSGNSSAAASGSSTPTKKVPPPPPPRRASQVPPSGPPPAIPERKTPGASSSGSHLSSSGASSGSLSALGHGSQQQAYDRSPFESAIDLELEDAAKCQQFRQNPFKPKGMCSNCLQFHD